MESLKRRLNRSIQIKLSFVLSVVIAAVAITAGIFSFVSALEDAHERQDDVLFQVADLMGRIQGSAPLALQKLELQDQDHDSSLFVQILDHTPAAHQDLGNPVPIPPTLADGLHTLDIGDKNFRVLIQPLAENTRIAVAQDTDLRDAVAIQDALRTLAPFLILVPILLLVIADLVRRVFQPTRALAEAVDARAETDLHPIADKNLPREIRPFIDAINRLLARVSESMETQRRFIADAAHELRSPATALALQAERLSKAEMSVAARERLQTLQQGLERNQHLLTQLLALLRAQATIDTPGGPSTHIGEVLRKVLETTWPLAEAKHIDIGVSGAEDTKIAVSELDLTILLRNLVDNAIRYTPDGGQVEVLVRTEPNTLVISVSDTGPGVPASEHQRILEPFYRVLGSGQTGSGLGLSIVTGITRKLQARIEFNEADPILHRGLLVSVAIPLKAPHPNQDAGAHA
ncbi:ATP-binding protein [Castellaniella sp. FW104-16D08]|uniref:ATP-binding protein n=1 Tax=unclassified Castellaniella TaxID=2617606 RepID=UPI003314C4D2